MRRWQLAQVATVRCFLRRSRTVSVSPPSFGCTSPALGGGGGGGSLNNSSRMYLPRSTGFGAVAVAAPFVDAGHAEQAAARGGGFAVEE